jgi:uncharacterized protein (DUF58 family)
VRGPAPEFSEYRSFRQGDDPRRLDWKLLARTDRAYLRLTEDRATLGTLLILDGSASMDFPTGHASKWRVAMALAVAFAQIAHQSGDPVGLFVPGVAGTALPPRTRRGVVAEIATVLDRLAPGQSKIGAQAISGHNLPPRIVLLSDFLDDDPGTFQTVAAHVGKGGEAHALRIIAREELDPPHQTFTALDPEAPHLSRPFGPAVRGVYRQRFLEWGAQVASRWRAAGASWHEMMTDEPLLRAIRRLIGRGP